MTRRLVTTVLLLAMSAVGCGSSAEPSERTSVVATTSVVADLTRNVAGSTADVTTLLPPAGEAHDFEPTPSDLDRVARADVIVASGVGLDDWVGDLREGAGSGAPVVDASEGARLIRRDGVDDPHIWMDPRNAVIMVNNIRDGLVRADPRGAATYRANAARCVAVLRALDRELAGQIAAVPVAERRIATDHDALAYLADRYRIVIVGTVIPSLAGGAEPSARDLADLADLVRREGVPVIFPEAGVNPDVAAAIARESGAAVGDVLFADSLGAPGSGAETYVEMMRADMRALVSGLGRG